MEFEDLSRQRIDYSEGPNGETIATLTLTLSDGSIHRFSESTDQEEIDALAAGLAISERNLMRIEGCPEEEIAGFFDFIGKAVKAVGNIAKKVVTSKVFKAAAKGLATIAPVLGPLAPVALGVSGAMAATSKLTSAAIAASGGAKRSAKKLTKAAIEDVARRVKSKKARSAMLRIANRKRKSAEKIAAQASRRQRQRRAGKPTRKKKVRPLAKVPSVFAAARAGRLRSHRRGDVSPKQLRKAMKTGRVYWLAKRAA